MLPMTSALLVELDLELVNTCGACPEQYDLVKPDGTKVAYFRLRHGYFRVEAPYDNGDIVYDASYPDGLKGMFDDDDERDAELSAGIRAVVDTL